LAVAVAQQQMELLHLLVQRQMLVEVEEAVLLVLETLVAQVVAQQQMEMVEQERQDKEMLAQQEHQMVAVAVADTLALVDQHFLIPIILHTLKMEALEEADQRF
jgi:hypothetical protein